MKSDAPAQQPVSKIRKRSPQLDLLRGVAIILVLFHHLRIDIPEASVFGEFFTNLHRVGWVGVDLFFVLSGFLVGGLLITELEKYGRINAKRFLIRRGLKIYPLYYAFFAYLFLMPLAKEAKQGGDMGATFGELWQIYWPNLLFINNYVGSNPIGHSWTLAIEEHFYLILPFFLMLLSKRLSMKQITWACAAVFIPVVAFRAYVVLSPDILIDKPKETHFRIDALFFGVAVRGLLASWPIFFSNLGKLRFPLVAIGAILMLLPEFVSVQFILSFGYALTMFGAAAVLIGVFQMRATDLGIFRVPGMHLVGLFCWVGVYSYSIYLWHITFFRILERFVEARWLNVVTHSMTAWVICALSIFVVTILISAVISRAVEFPVLKFRDRFFPSRSNSIPTEVSVTSSVTEPVSPTSATGPRFD